MVLLMPEYRSISDPVDENGRLYPLLCRPGDVADFVLLPGDPHRVGRLSALWDDAHEVAHHRTHVVHSGRSGGYPISAVSLGAGNASAANVVEALARLGVTTLLRAGSCGSLQPDMHVGDLVISSAVVRLDGASRTYVDPGYPAVAHHEAVIALVEAAEELGYPYHVGVTASADGWYVTQGRTGYRGYRPSWMRELITDLRQSRVIGMEAESAGLYTVAGIYGLRAAAVCAVYADRLRDEFAPRGMDRCIATVTRAAQVLRRMDAEREASGSAWWTPQFPR